MSPHSQRVLSWITFIANSCDKLPWLLTECLTSSTPSRRCDKYRNSGRRFFCTMNGFAEFQANPLYKRISGNPIIQKNFRQSHYTKEFQAITLDRKNFRQSHYMKEFQAISFHKRICILSFCCNFKANTVKERNGNFYPFEALLSL